MQLVHFDTDAFLRDFWQKRPLLIRNPWAGWQCPLSPDELAGLACEADVESRLIMREGEQWLLENGPFAESRFAALANATFTLLVQAVDQHVPQVAALIEPFRFIPDWRIDDVMVSYATNGGGVGPHFDQYDVFLVQGAGQRRWRVGQVCDASTRLQPHNDLRLIAEFSASEEWLLGPGDILYLPPGYAHDGVGEGEDCMTFSIGFRAPSQAELAGGFAEALLTDEAEHRRFTDPDLALQANPGEITAASLARLHDLALEALGDREAFARWFGQYATAPKYPEIDWRPDQPTTPEKLSAMLKEGPFLLRNPASRLAFIRQPAGAVLLFADGQIFACSPATAPLAERLCEAREWRISADLAADDAAIELLGLLANQGSIAFGEPE